MNRWVILTTLGLLSLAVVACGTSSDSDDSTAMSRSGELSSDPGGEQESPPMVRTGDGGANAVSDEGSSGSGSDDFASQADGRKVIVTSELTLEAEDVTARFLEVGRLARLREGFVSDSQLLTREVSGETLTYASISVRVPSSGHDDLLMVLRTMEGVEVRGEQSTAREVTEEYTDLTSRLTNLERTETQYLQLLTQASTIEDILRVNDRIDGVRMEIDRIQGRLNVLNDLVDLATVTVSLEPAQAEVAVAGEASGNRFTQAWKDAWKSMGDFAGDASVAGAWGLVLAICAAPFALLALTARAMARRKGHAGGPGGSVTGPA